MNYADVREGIYNHLVAEITEVAGRVYWYWTAPADSPKPLIEFALIGEVPALNPCLALMQMEVLVMGEPSDILALDPIADAVVAALHQQPVTTPLGHVGRPQYVRDSRIDTWIEKLNACAIRLKFLLPSGFWT